MTVLCWISAYLLGFLLTAMLLANFSGLDWDDDMNGPEVPGSVWIFLLSLVWPVILPLWSFFFKLLPFVVFLPKNVSAWNEKRKKLRVEQEKVRIAEDRRSRDEAERIIRELEEELKGKANP